MRWQIFRRELNIIPRTLPQKPALTKQVMSLKRMTRVQSDGAEIEIDPARLHVETIKVHHDDDHAGEIIGGLAVTNQCWIVRSMKPQVVIALERPVLFADPVQPGNETL